MRRRRMGCAARISLTEGRKGLERERHSRWCNCWSSLPSSAFWWRYCCRPYRRPARPHAARSAATISSKSAWDCTAFCPPTAPFRRERNTLAGRRPFVAKRRAGPCRFCPIWSSPRLRPAQLQREPARSRESDSRNDRDPSYLCPTTFFLEEMRTSDGHLGVEVSGSVDSTGLTHHGDIKMDGIWTSGTGEDMGAIDYTGCTGPGTLSQISSRGGLILE